MAEFTLSMQENREIIEVSMSEPILTFYHAPMYVAGRYTKSQRNIAQSPWINKSLQSVSGYIDAIVTKHFQADGCKFCSAGREDIDVKMLGEGRPFLLEICNPRRYLLLRAHAQSGASLPPQNSPLDVLRKLLDTICSEVLQASLGSVSIIPRLWLVRGTASAQLIKVGEVHRPKLYKATISSKVPLVGCRNFKTLSINQKTPIRVLHRRANLNRSKMIYECELSPFPEDGSFVEVTIRAQAGTYRFSSSS